MSSTRSRIAILDTDPSSAMALASHVESAGYEARATDDAQEFLDWANTWDPALVFVDIVSDTGGAITTLGHLANSGSRAGVVLVSGTDRAGIREAREFETARGLVQAGLLRKPFTRDSVMMTLARSPHALESVDQSHNPIDDWDEITFRGALSDAVANREFRMVYQPKIECATGKVVAFEALARWDHPLLGQIPPGVFIPRASQLGLMRPITRAVISHALAWFGTARSHTDERLCINISAGELTDSEHMRELGEEWEHIGVSPERVVLEITHTSALADNQKTIDSLHRLREAGFSLAIDDFGTGYSTTARLSSLPFSEIKIDTRFVRKSVRSESASALVEGMINMARDLDLYCTAEGVEDERILDKITALGCDFAQGYHIAKPMPAGELEAWLAER